MRHRIFIRAVGVCSTIVAASGCATTALLEQELIKTNTQTVLAFEETVFNKHQVQEAFAHYIGVGYIEHDPSLAGEPARVSGPEQPAQRAYDAMIAREGPEAHRTFERSIAQRELVVTQSLWSSPSRAGAARSVIDIYRLRDGRIVEHWDVVGEQAGGLRGSVGDAVPGKSLPP